jgi:hypothetical protein
LQRNGNGPMLEELATPLPSGMKMMRPSPTPRVSTMPGMPICRLYLGFHVLVSSRIRIQQRSRFCTSERTSLKNKHANSQDAE